MPVRTLIGDEVRRAAFTTIVRERLAHDMHLFCAARWHVVQQRNRRPELTQIASARRSRTGAIMKDSRVKRSGFDRTLFDLSL